MPEHLIHLTLHNRWAGKTLSWYRDIKVDWAGVPRKGDVVILIEGETAPYCSEVVSDVVWSRLTGTTVHFLTVLDPAMLIEASYKPNTEKVD